MLEPKKKEERRVKEVSGIILEKSNPSLERDQKTSWLFSGNLGLLTHITYIEETRDLKIGLKHAKIIEIGCSVPWLPELLLCVDSSSSPCSPRFF